MLKLKVESSRAYSFLYPPCSCHPLLRESLPRRAIITSIRDLRSEPLIGTAPSDERWLAIGQDLDTGEELGFYLSRMRNVIEIDADEQPLKVAGYAVVDGRRVSHIATTLPEALAFIRGAKRGVLCGVLNTDRTKVG